MKKIIILCLLVLAGCSQGGFESVSQVLPESKPAQKEVMEANVKVYSVAGSTDGIVFLADGRDKWIVTEAIVMRDHPKALIETSNGQQLEAKLQAFSVEDNIAILHVRNSADVEAVEQGNQQQLVDMLETEALTAIERYTLHNAFKDTEVPQKYDMTVLEQYEKTTFEYNPDALEAFIQTFNTAFNQYVASNDFAQVEPYILSDLLKEAMVNEEKKLLIENFEVTEIGKSGFEWYIKGQTNEFPIVYKINLVDGNYYITYLQIEK
ncbi:hypothetical protein [Lysinibacillus sp. LZ02]|uniref:hypothetical protein n=1 Tax=Lysinibacillus sp. LZ02 TaxID=3420668 RepID=UPI003D36028B